MRIHWLSLFILLVVNFNFASAEETVTFPPGFRWCVATAAHQIEGGNDKSDWWAWEALPGNVKNAERSGAACDHWNRVDQDVALMKDLSVGTYRLSVEWAKIEPTEGQYDPAAIAHYRKEIETLVANGIEPMVTLQHFTFPKWIADKGGWEWPGIPEAFAKYTAVVYTQIAPQVRDWVTVNEPNVSVMNGYVYGTFPPSQKRTYDGVVPVFRGILKGHAQAYAVLHALAQKSGHAVRVGMANHLRTMDPANKWNPLDRLGASLVGQMWNWSLPDALETGRFKMNLLWIVNNDEEIPGLKGTQDFIGINYYTGDLIHVTLSGQIQPLQRAELEKNELGWDIYPEGFYRVLKAAAERYPGKPIFITENGIADSKDRLRPKYLRDHLREVARAINEGVKIEGYCHWSLMDNFEWAEGFTPRFGLYEMDYKTLERRPRPSAELFRDIAKRNALQ